MGRAAAAVATQSMCQEELGRAAPIWEELSMAMDMMVTSGSRPGTLLLAALTPARGQGTHRLPAQQQQQ